MIAMVTTEVNRMGHMPGPPWWKCVEIEVNMNFLSDGPRSGVRVQVWALRKCKRGSTAQPGEMLCVVQISTSPRAVASRDASRRNATAPPAPTCGTKPLARSDRPDAKQTEDRRSRARRDPAKAGNLWAMGHVKRRHAASAVCR